MIQALHYDIVCNKVIIRACIMDSEMPYFLVWSLSSSAWCIMQYTVYACLVSCHFYAIPLTLSIQNSILRLAVCILHPTETQSPSHIQNAKDTPTITSLRNYNYVIPPTKWPARAPYRALPAIRWPHAGRHLALVTFVHPT